MGLRSDEIRAMLAEKFSKEKKRLKSFGTKVSSFDLANAVARHVEAMMTDSRHRELKKLENKLAIWNHVTPERIKGYVKERSKATKAMAKAIENVANDNESKRPWKAARRGKGRG